MSTWRLVVVCSIYRRDDWESGDPARTVAVAEGRWEHQVADPDDQLHLSEAMYSITRRAERWLRFQSPDLRTTAVVTLYTMEESCDGTQCCDGV